MHTFLAAFQTHGISTPFFYENCLNAHIQVSTDISLNELAFDQSLYELLDLVDCRGLDIPAVVEVSRRA